MVLFLMGLIGVAVPVPESFSAVKRHDSIVSMITADLRWARMNSILEKKRYLVKVYKNGYGDGDKPEYVIFVDDGGTERIVRRNLIPKEYTLYRNLIPRPLEDVFHWTTFHPRGSAGTGTLCLQNSQGRMIKIVISNMGRVRLEED